MQTQVAKNAKLGVTFVRDKKAVSQKGKAVRAVRRQTKLRLSGVLDS